ncbi:MAG: hypothetical protein ACRC92_26250 [Peptostreptococcaceae bacterium]
MIRLESIKNEFITNAGASSKRAVCKDYETEVVYVDIENIVYAQSVNRDVVEDGVPFEDAEQKMFGIVTYLNGQTHGVQHKNVTVTLETFEKLVRAVNCTEFGLLTKNSGLRVGTVERGDIIETHIFNVYDIANITPTKCGELDKVQILRSWLPNGAVNNNSYIKVKDIDVVLSKDLGKNGMKLGVFNDLVVGVVDLQNVIMSRASKMKHNTRYSELANRFRMAVTELRRIIMDSVYPQKMDNENKLSRALGYIDMLHMEFIREFDIKVLKLSTTYSKTKEWCPNFNIKRPTQFVYDVEQWMSLVELSRNIAMLNIYDEYGLEVKDYVDQIESAYSELRDVRLKNLNRPQAIKCIELYECILDISGIYKDYGYAIELDLILCALKSKI